MNESLATRLADAGQAAEDHLVGLGPLLIGIVITVLLVLTVTVGVHKIRRSVGRSQPPLQHPGHRDTTGHGAEVTGSTGHERELREPDEMPHDGRRRYPNEIGNWGTHRGKTDGRRRWDFGSRGGDVPK
ncbi:MULTISPECIES: DUF6479 family protein [unclassified Streptomyces]|uniref:DUF6479 family protein n=1 Tax=unclassified Streptomyces TaxID=2593676 RepID=UPI0022B6A371|nr:MULTISPECIES: DUF6479 family protein [unclassified Streptomyces]MCZ7414687.1 DUF6479 family protein [Streptomyces sp. WMMC897]MCZ7431616.1 DUF6479 family protein [Streptomyces sp. WMMC1477]